MHSIICVNKSKKKRQNNWFKILIVLFSGPNQPKNFNSFLRPIVDELKELEGNWFIIFYDSNGIIFLLN